MQWIKWVRKNRQTIMVVVVILCMVTFVGGVGFTEFLKYLGHGRRQTYATYGKGKKITNFDMMSAHQELEVLKAIQADVVLRYKPNTYGMPDFNSQLLGYLLFGDTQMGSQIRRQLLQYAQRGQILVTTAQIDAYFNQEQERPEATWILLCAETRKAGIVVPNGQSAALLREMIPQLTGNRVDAATAIRGIAARMNIAEEEILAAFGKLLGILKWADQVCNNENVTLAQLRASIGRMMERIDVDFARFPADWFIAEQTEPTAQQVQTQFDAWKEAASNSFSKQNPYGFGYKLPLRVQMEYIYVRNDDVKKRIDKPTAGAVEEYYENNIEQFRVSRPVDPNKPDGEKITEIRPCAEAADEIYRILEQQRSEKLTQLIFKDIRDMLDAEMIGLDFENASAQQIREAAADFATAAAKATEKYKVPVHTGKTGLLSPADFAKDRCLSGLEITHAGLQTPLYEAFFAVDAQNAPTRRKLGVYIPRMWESIGPLTGSIYSEKDFSAMLLTIICRVIDVRPSEVPGSVDVTYSTAGIADDDKEDEEKVFNLRQQVIDDLKKTAAMEIAGKKAEELRQLIGEVGWDKAIDEYNAKYAPRDPNNLDDKAFRKLAVNSLRRQLLASAGDIEQIRQLMRDNPVTAGFLQTRIVSNMLNHKFFALATDDAQTDVMSEIVEFKPTVTYYIVKSITRQPATTEEYLQRKPYAALRTSMDSASGLGLIHFDPKQIQKRMNYVPVRQDMIASPPVEIPVEE